MSFWADSAKVPEALSSNPACLRFRPSLWFSSFFWCYITLGWLTLLMLAHQNRGRLSHPGSLLRMLAPSSSRECICSRAHGFSHGPAAAQIDAPPIHPRPFTGSAKTQRGAWAELRESIRFSILWRCEDWRIARESSICCCPRVLRMD